jgi:basic membrane lipoprotein Med (substrate-binding protein (PBP1-ABC) superfamily)/DNA-binding SARP family transcriptional activator
MNFRVLGTVQAEVEGQLVDLGPPKQRALLALLLLNSNQVVATDRLVDLIWGESAPRTAAHSVQIYVSALRKLFADEGERLETRAPGYLLKVQHEELDSLRFQAMVESGDVERLRSALGLWSGDPLADFTYEDWAQPHIRRLRGLWARAVEMLAEAELEDGRAAAVPELLHSLITSDPLREEPRRLLMLALYRRGRQAEALRTYREFRTLLIEEMGVEPTSDLVQLEEQILLQDPVLAPRRSLRTATAIESRNPYKGLGAFDELDASDFFGRDKLVSDMASSLAGGARLLVVVGPSGSGKSSAVRAGLIPALRQGRVPGSDQWILSTMMPGRHPFEQLEAALLRVSRTPAPTILEQLNEDATGLLRVALRIVNDGGAELVLLIDQFEELFTLATERTRRRFIDNLVTAVTDLRSRVRVVLTLRADFYDRPLLSHRFAPVFASSVINVLPLTPAELEAAIVEPAAGVGVGVDPALLAQLIADVGDEAQVLPLLQFTLTELFEIRRGGRLDITSYRALGGLEGSLTARADQLFETFAPEGREAAKRLLLHLVQSDRGSEPTRRRVPLDDLRQLGEVDEVLGALIANRLLSADRDPLTGKATVQVTHEALLDGWGRLRGWIDLYLTDLQRRSALSVAAAEWEASGDDSDFLLTGGRLMQLEEWSRETTIELGVLETSFLQASLQQREARAGEDEERRLREASVARRAKQRLWALAAALSLLAATITYGALALAPEPLPPIAYISEGRGDGSYLDALATGFDLAASELGDGAVGEYTTNWLEAPNEIRRLEEEGVRDFVLTANLGGTILDVLAPELPENRFAIIDSLGEHPNVQYVNFATHEGSFLVGAIAALRSETNTIGFIGGMPSNGIRAFQAGFEAGARHVRPDIEVLVEYLAPEWDLGGAFGSPTLAQAKTEPVYQAGADVIYHATGMAGQGVFEAARLESARQGRHLWVIGVDVDEFFSVLNSTLVYLGGPDPRAWQPHILTSMIKRYDFVMQKLLKDLAADQFQPGLRMFHLADKGMGFSTSGGFIDELVPTIEDLKARIITGEILVPDNPSA